MASFRMIRILVVIPNLRVDTESITHALHEVSDETRYRNKNPATLTPSPTTRQISFGNCYRWIHGFGWPKRPSV